ncbi:MAG: replication restart helicase PriA [Acutalibacteraceae bacterium]|jgi:primosomal protein N' (replication factor Y)
MGNKKAKVAVENTVYEFDKDFDYLIPDALINLAMPGCRVVVPFGRGNVKRIGIILKVCSFIGDDKLKSIEAVLDEAPLLTHEQLELVYWLKDRTFCTLFEAAKAMLPTGLNYRKVQYFSVSNTVTEDIITDLEEDELKVYEHLKDNIGFQEKESILSRLDLRGNAQLLDEMARKGVLSTRNEAEKKVGDLTRKMAKLSDSFDEESFSTVKITSKQQVIVNLLKDVGCAAVKEITYFTGYTEAVIKALERKGIVEIYQEKVFRSPLKNTEADCKSNYMLSQQQQTALDGLLEKYHAGKYSVSLLYGVTGSGKTIVYQQLIEKAVNENKGVILMVPEIALTPQTVSIFNRLYGKKVALFHSALSIGERADEWERVKNGEAIIVIGTRSAVFAPLDNIGLIIIDEEQEQAYKSEKSPRYNARDVAKFRCYKHNALLLLTSATPSVETFAAAKEGKYSLFELSERFGNAILPEVIIVDMKNEVYMGNNSEISEKLSQELINNFQDKKQTILLINRRGYNTFIACSSCGHVLTCPYCSISLRYHSNNGRLMCHYCGFSKPKTEECPECNKESLRYSGFGTQKIEDVVSNLIPQAKILRMDTDTTSSRFSHERKFNEFRQGKYDIMIGTQMVAKGLDFENVTLVGVVSVDQQLYNDDYRSMESTFALLTQVVGRSGRGNFKGKAVIQTMTPENDVIRLASEQDYLAFFKTEIQIRKLLVYPPYCDICVFGFSGEDETKVSYCAEQTLIAIQSLTNRPSNPHKMIVLGPVPARVFKTDNQYRYRLIVKCRNSLEFRNFVREILDETSKTLKDNKVFISVDINPYNII